MFRQQGDVVLVLTQQASAAGPLFATYRAKAKGRMRFTQLEDCLYALSKYLHFNELPETGASRIVIANMAACFTNLHRGI